jgi:hypothetical protein
VRDFGRRLHRRDRHQVESGIKPPCGERTYIACSPARSERNGASACTYTRYERSWKSKSLTYWSPRTRRASARSCRTARRALPSSRDRCRDRLAAQSSRNEVNAPAKCGSVFTAPTQGSCRVCEGAEAEIVVVEHLELKAAEVTDTLHRRRIEREHLRIGLARENRGEPRQDRLERMAAAGPLAPRLERKEINSAIRRAAGKPEAVKREDAFGFGDGRANLTRDRVVRRAARTPPRCRSASEALRSGSPDLRRG